MIRFARGIQFQNVSQSYINSKVILETNKNYFEETTRLR